ncbi:MAG: chitobiase/beta-hexosaminidase C-terminal domain-containing protein [Kiritimatiellae bacterium]|nr:chitobiase/beta-hexosaminidase C-terminal domain-containing protein [Kiritimatiellia bacterium]
MRKYILLLGAAVALCASAAEHVIDLRQSAVALPSPAVGDTLDVRIPDGPEFALRIVSAPPPGIAGQSFIARDDASGAAAVVKRDARGFRATIDDVNAGRIWSVRIAADGAPGVSFTDKGDEPEECATCAGYVPAADAGTEEVPSQGAAKSVTRTRAGAGFTYAQQKGVVDILVAFDKGAVAKSKTLGYSTIEEFADYAVNKMNIVLQNSQLDHLFSYRLVGVTTIDATYTAVNNDVLTSLRFAEGPFAKIPALRDKYGADTVTLLINRTGGTTNGIGFGLQGNTPQILSDFIAQAKACNVCDIGKVYERYTMCHETGHNMGCGHSNLQGSNSGPESAMFPYSCGYHFFDSAGIPRHTIMAYNYWSVDDTGFQPVPYFSTPDITPDEYGVPLGTVASNDNRRVLMQTYEGVSAFREHILPYDWDVKFLDNDGNDIPDGTYFPGYYYVTLSHENPDATIYYTDDGTEPTSEMQGWPVGTRLTLSGSKTLTACAVVDGVAQSVRTINFVAGLTWSGDADGNGIWRADDSSLKPWSGEMYYDGDAVLFPDLAGVANATVTVKGPVAPGSVSFTAGETAYVLDKGDDDAQLSIPDASFSPTGDVEFNVPVLFDAVAFTNTFGRTMRFNAPFGQTLSASGGYCTNMIGIAPYATLTVAPGVGKTQTLDTLNNQGWFAGTSTFRVGEGTVLFKGPINGSAGVIGRTKLEVGNGGSLVFDVGGGTGYEMNQTSLTVEKGGSVTFNQMEHLKRTLYLDGGTIYAKRFDLMSNPGVYVTDDSSIENNNGGYILFRGADSQINVSAGKTLTLNVGTQTDGRSDTSGWGIFKKGDGTIVANNEFKHSGVTQIDEGTLEVGYSSGSTVYGQGWIVASNTTLRVKSGCTLKVPSLTLDPTATVSVPASSSVPIVVTDALSVSEVTFELNGVESPAAGDAYALVKSNVSIDGVGSANASLPNIGNALKWEIAAEDGVLYAKVLEKSAVEKAVSFCSNVDSLTLSAPDDATVSEAGGAQIASSPIVIDGLFTKAVSIAVRFVVPETSPSTAATICSLKLGSNTINCMRATNGDFACCYNGLQTSANATNTVALSAGEHLLQIGYYAERNVNGEMGTRVLLDGRVVYYGTGLKFSDDSVSHVAIGATAGDAPQYPYPGLVVREIGVLDVKSSDPAPRMTASAGDVTYAYNPTNAIPRIFPLTPSGAVSMDEAMLSASYSRKYDALSVSVVAAFPNDAVGTIFCAAVDASLSNPYSSQVEHRGNGLFAFRDNGNDALKTSVQTDLDVSVRHLYTLTYTKGYGYRLYVDGEEILNNDAYYKDKGYSATAKVYFGCGAWSSWVANWNDNPNPFPGLDIYASHIALGTDDRTVSEAAVAAAMSDGEDGEEVSVRLPTVDVLVAFDNGAQSYLGSRSLEEFAQTQIGLMNAVLATNRLDRYYSYRLAGVCKVDGTYNNIDTAPGLAAAGEGPAVSLRAARELYGADTVTLLVDTTSNTIGNSSPLNSPNDVASQHECAFSVCSIRAVDTGKQHTMIHENAHNMGCGHARAQSVINSPFEYGRGYYFKDGNVTRHTIMAYGGDNDASWYFSTSSDEFGFTLGDSTNDNARVLRETCGEVAKWRDGAAIDFDGVEVDGATLQTSERFPWYVDGNGFVRSYNQTEYGMQSTMPLRATIAGPKVLSFKHKSYFGGTSVAGNNYSHFDVLLDDSPVITQTEYTNSWTAARVEIPSGTHEVVFVFSQRFAMNNSRDYKDGAPEADDAVWLKDICLEDSPAPEAIPLEVSGDAVTTELQLAFKNATLSLLTADTLGGKFAGGWAGTASGADVDFNNFDRTDEATGTITCQAQVYDDGYLKGVLLTFTQEGDDVYVQMTAARYRQGAEVGTSIADGTNARSPDVDGSSWGYAVYTLTLDRTPPEPVVEAPEPIAVWVGDFKTATKNGCTLDYHANKLFGGVVTITTDESVASYEGVHHGVDVTLSSPTNAITVIVKYSDLNYSTANGRMFFTSCADSNGEYDRTALRLTVGNKIKGSTSDNSGPATTDNGTLADPPASSGYMAFSYGNPDEADDRGTLLCSGSEEGAINTTNYWVNALKHDEDSTGSGIYGATVGGYRKNANPGQKWYNATGMRIEAIAVFGKRLTEAERNAYRFPEPFETYTGTDYPVPYSWFANYGVQSADVETTAVSASSAPKGAGSYTWWECFVLGLDPTGDDTFLTTIRMDGPTPVVEFSPTNEILRASGDIDYVLEGRTSLTNDWSECDSFDQPGDTNRFFRVKVVW